MRKINGWVILSLSALFLSCERAIEFTPGFQEPKLVVDATIENGKRPMVYLTTSMDFFSNISLDSLTGLFVHNAVVKLSDGNKTHTLREYKEPAGEGFFLYYYSIDSSSPASSFKGEHGKTYTLDIESNGKEYSATTTIPHLEKTLESLYYKEGVDDEDSTKVTLYGQFKDPPGFGNYSRYFTKVNGQPYLPGLSSVYDDKVIDGKAYEMQIEQGVDRNTEIDYEEYSFFRKGDTITVKFCNIDKAVFDFWRTMEYSYSSIGNPFSSPTKVKGNVSNGALGYFGGYAVQYSSIIIPE